MFVAIAIVLGIIVGLAAGLGAKWYIDKHSANTAESLTKNARREADTILKEAKIQAKEERLKARDDFERSTREQRNKIKKLEERLDTKEANIERKADLLESRIAEIDKRENAVRDSQEKIQQKENKLEELVNREIKELEHIAAMSREDAQKQLMERLEEELRGEQGVMIKRFHEEGKQRCTREAQEIMVNTMERYAGDCAYDRTTTTIPLPNDEMKGRIIGREGRNIRSIEAATGTNLLIDDTPEAVVVSCFDPVRRVIASIALERLVADGRIHPTRVEEVVKKVKDEIDSEIEKAGQEAVEELGLNIKPELVNYLGRLRYRYSYSQNVLQHSIECAYMMGAIAAQIGLDEQEARRAGLLHDIGKAVDHEVEGSHALIGADLLKRHGEKDNIINAIAAHHEDTERNSLLANLVCICDKLSASRPGARSETTELFLKRIEKLETIGNEVEGVENCYAIQAGRELRVIVKPENIDEGNAAYVARDIAKRIEKEMRYPGQVRVTVIRETRSVEYAK
ncbi:MAG: ribonuclease Y [Lentisphaeria bacterium]